MFLRLSFALLAGRSRVVPGFRITRLFSVIFSTLLLPGLTMAGPVLVITPTGTETPIDEVPIPVTVITHEQIQQSASADVAELLSGQVGIDMARNGGPGSVTSLFVRGAESNHVVVLLDGVKINPATIGGAALQNIPLSMIQRIEIVKGPRSSLYGSDAIAAVVNIITVADRKASYVNGSIGLASHDSHSASFDMGWKDKAFSAGLSLSYLDSEGFPVSDLSENDHGYNNNSVRVFAGYDKDGNSFKVNHWQSEGSVEYYSFGELQQDFLNSSSAIQSGFALNDNWTLGLDLSQSRDEIEQQVVNYLDQYDYADSVRNMLQIKLDYLPDTHSQWTMGAEYAVDQVDALSYGTLIDEDTNINAWYALLRQRYEQQIFGLALRATDHEDFGDNLSWNFDYQWQQSYSMKWFAAVGSAFRAPDATDRFGYIGNPDLDPETSTSIELGLRFQPIPITQLTVSLFDTHISDLIEPNASFTQMENIQKARIYGVEVAGEHKFPQWKFAFNGVLQDPHNETLDEPLSRRPRYTVNLSSAYKVEQWSAGITMKFVGLRDDSSYSDIKLDPYQLLGLTASRQLSKATHLRFRADNVTDEDYQTADGFNTAGRTYRLVLEHQFL